MMHRFYFSSCLLFCFLYTANVYAAIGDTISIRAHEETHMNWYGAYDNDVLFPSADLSFRKIMMYYTIGCPQSGCSDWDYDVHIEALIPTGTFDSSVVSVDTISVSPLVIDTAWNVFEVKESFELGRMITPYGTYMNYNNPAYGTAGYDSSWTHTYSFDVSDFAPLLKDSVTVRVFFSGWQDGFTSTVDFSFIEGIPPQQVLSIQNVYNHGGTYLTSTQFETDILPSKSMTVPLGATSSRLRVTVSGHGADDSGCGEFCQKSYYVLVDNTQIGEHLMWRDDCDQIALQPQGGTWLFHRGNWCPGDKVYTQHFDVPGGMLGQTKDINIDVEPYTASTVGGGSNPSHNFDVQLVSYGSFNFLHDVAVEQIKAPSNNENYSQFNPICDQPIVTIKNMGLYSLQQVDIAYWVEGGEVWHHQWQGNLPSGESTDVVLPQHGWAGMDSVAPVFHVELSWPNNLPDEYPYDNQMSGTFSIPPVYESDIVFRFRTNRFPEENWFHLVRADGDTIAYKDVSDFPNSFNTYDFDFSLDPGCYLLSFFDFDNTNWGAGDGLDWWFNNHPQVFPNPSDRENAGYIELRSSTNQLIHRFESDFGHKITHAFTVGYRLDQEEAKTPPPPPIHTSMTNTNSTTLSSSIYPNPTSDVLMIDWPFSTKQGVVCIFDMLGQKVLEQKVVYTGSSALEVPLTSVPSGIYTVFVSDKNQAASTTFIINQTH